MTQRLELSAELDKFVRAEAGLSARQTISPSTEIVEGLQIDGIDCEYLMEAFFGKWSIEPGDYEYFRYFYPEPLLDPLPSLSKHFYRRKMQGIELHEEKEPLTLGMLQHAIELGVWDTARLRLFYEQFRLPAGLETFILEYTGLMLRGRPGRCDQINADYLLTGFDPARLMSEFFDRFGVDRGDYDFYRYFEKAGFREPPSLLRRLFRNQHDPAAAQNLEPLTLDMLARAIQLGVWDSGKLRAATTSPGK